MSCFFFQAEAGIRDLVRSRGLGDVYKRQLFVNVPSWWGKTALEFSAFRLGLSPAEEMNDHRRYYDPRDLWPKLVEALSLIHI